MTVRSDFFGGFTSCCHRRYFVRVSSPYDLTIRGHAYNTRVGNALFNAWWNSVAKALNPSFDGCSSLCQELVCWRQRALAVDERHAGMRRLERLEYRGELLEQDPRDGECRRLRREAAQVEGRLEPRTEETDAAAIGDGEVVAVKEQAGLRAEAVAQGDQVFVARAHQRQRGVEPRLVDERGRRQRRVEVPDPQRHRVVDDVVAAAGEEHRVPRPARRTAVGELLDQHLALLHAEHVAHLVAGLGEVQDRHAQRVLEPRDDAAAEERHGVVEPRITFGEHLERPGRRLGARVRS